MNTSPGVLDHHIQVGKELLRQQDIHRLRDELGLEPQGTLEHLAHLEKYLPQERWFGPHAKKLWLEWLATALNCDEVPFLLDDPLGQWLAYTLPQLGYRVKIETYLTHNIAVIKLTNIAGEVHESILEMARQLEFIAMANDGTLIIPPLLRGHEFKRLGRAQQVRQLPGVLDAQLVLDCLAILYNSNDNRPSSFPNLRGIGRQGMYDPSERLLYMDVHNGWAAPTFTNELRHYLVHYMDGRIAHRLGIAIQPPLENDTVHSPYLFDLHKEFLTK